MNSDMTQRKETQEDFGRQNTNNSSQLDYPQYQTTQLYKNTDKYQNDYSGAYFDNSLQEEDSKDEESYQGNQTQGSNGGFENQNRAFDQENYLNQHLAKQYQTQNVNQKFYQRQSIFDNKKDKAVNVFSNSFDESAPALDLKPQRNCKSSTRMLNKTQKRQTMAPSFPVNLIHNVSTGSGVLTAGSLNKKQGAFNNFMKTKQMQSSYQQAILSQLQRANTQNSFDMKNLQDLSNRSMVQTPGAQNAIGNSFMINQYFGSTMNQQSNKPVTPHNNSGNNQAVQQMMLSAGSQMNPRQSNGMNQSTMDPYTYLRWKQQKYKSCRSIQANGGTQFKKQNQHIIANSAYLLHQKKGNQTQKTNNNNKSICSSNGSVLGSASMTTTMTGIKSLGEVKNPSMFISWRFCDRKLTDLKDIAQFKNLSDLDISGNLLQSEVQELRQLQFLKKLNLSHNQIIELYPLPHNLEILNISNNSIKSLNPEVTILLKNLTTLDISNNGLENLEGIQNMKRLKRLLCKNNLIIDTQPMNELTTIVEIDFENNPIESYPKLIESLLNKNDILVLNLKMSPLMLMITNYDQLLTDLTIALEPSQSLCMDWIKAKLKFFSSGCLYRTKRVYLKIKTMQQHSKRSSSNFSNGSSSCGRHAVNTGGRGNNATSHISNINNTSNIHAFSPLLNNTVTTPNNQYTTQRLEDIEQLYDEILDEEEEIERKHNKIHKKKHKKSGQNQDDDSVDEDESDEDFNHPSMSCDEEVDDLQSFRNHPNLNNEFLNESTADFNKEIRQINQELREQLGPEYLNDNGMQNIEHIQSLHSTQSLSTNKKNPISFKLDLSKCTQQQSEEDDFDNTKVPNDEIEDDQFEIPGLQYVKVTDDSFRQMEKQQSQQQSLRNKLEKVQIDTSQPETKKNTLREYPSKQIQKQIFIPKLELGILLQNSNQSNIPIKQTINQSLNLNNSKKSLQSMKTFKNEDDLSMRDQTKLPDICGQSICVQLRKEYETLKNDYELSNKKQQNEISQLRKTIDEIKNIFSFKCEFQILPKLIHEEKNLQIQENLTLKQNLSNSTQKCKDLEIQLQAYNHQKQDDYLQKYEECEKTVQQLQEQLKLKDKQSTERIMSQDMSLNFAQLSTIFDVKRTQSTQYEQSSKQLLNNPQYFYQTDHNKEITCRKDKPSDTSTVLENLSLYSMKKFTCDIKKVKRPQSVVGHRKSSFCIKINSLLKQDGVNNTNLSNIDDTQYANEYGSTQDYQRTQDNQNLGDTMNKKVGHYIERLKERNSSLQERLNGSFGSSNQPAKTKVSPLNIQKVNLNMTQQQEIISNPYIISPSNDENSQQNIASSGANKQPGATQRVSMFKAQVVNHKQSKDTTVIRKVSNVDSNSSVNEYSSREYQTQGNQHSKTQRINVKKIQYNQFFLSNINANQGNNNQSAVVQNKDKSTDYQINLGVSGKNKQIQNKM